MDYRIGICGSCQARFKIPASFAHPRARCRNCDGVVAIGPVESEGGGRPPRADRPARGDRASGDVLRAPVPDRTAARRSDGSEPAASDSGGDAGRADPRARTEPAVSAPAAESTPARASSEAQRASDGGPIAAKRPASDVGESTHENGDTDEARPGSLAPSRSSARRTARDVAPAVGPVVASTTQAPRARAPANAKRKRWLPAIVALAVIAAVALGFWLVTDRSADAVDAAATGAPEGASSDTSRPQGTDSGSTAIHGPQTKD